MFDLYSKVNGKWIWYGYCPMHEVFLHVKPGRQAISRPYT